MNTAKHSFLPLLVGSLTSFTCPAETLGRLFFTPEQRRLLEDSRQAPERNDGFLKSPNGREIQWIDGKTQDATRSTTPIGDSRQTPLLPSGSVLRHPAPEKR